MLTEKQTTIDQLKQQMQEAADSNTEKEQRVKQKIDGAHEMVHNLEKTLQEVKDAAQQKEEQAALRSQTL